MAESFDTRLCDASLAAAADRDRIKVFKHEAREHPTEAAAAVCSGVPLAGVARCPARSRRHRILVKCPAGRSPAED